MFIIMYLSKSQELLLRAVAASGLVIASEDFVQQQQCERYDDYFQKARHGCFVRSQDENLDTVASVYWLIKGDLGCTRSGTAYEGCATCLLTVL